MNIFGVGGAELVVIILIMLIVAGPQRMLHWAYLLGKFTARMRDIWKEVMAVVQQEIDQAGIDVKLPDEMPTRQNIARWGQEAIKPYTDKMREAEAEVRGELADVEKEVRTFTSEANAVAADFSQMDKDLKREGKAPAQANGQANGQAKDAAADGRFGTWGGAEASAPAEIPPAADIPTDDTPAEGTFGTWSRN